MLSPGPRKSSSVAVTTASASRLRWATVGSPTEVVVPSVRGLGLAGLGPASSHG